MTKALELADELERQLDENFPFPSGWYLLDLREPDWRVIIAALCTPAPKSGSPANPQADAEADEYDTARALWHDMQQTMPFATRDKERLKVSFRVFRDMLKSHRLRLHLELSRHRQVAEPLVAYCRYCDRVVAAALPPDEQGGGT